jgi:hypothetical protein
LVIFHDTNLKNRYFRRNKTIGIGWDNQRGVIRAIEEYFNISVNENQNFIINNIKKNEDDWKIEHDPICNGLIICKRNLWMLFFT